MSIETGTSPVEQRGASVVERVRRIDAGGPVVAAYFLGTTAIFALGEADLLFVADDGGDRHVRVHDGGILDVAANRDVIATCGDDGRICLTGPDATPRVIATDAKQRWIDKVAINAAGAVA